MLEFQQVSLHFDEKTVLDNFSFSAREGEHTCLLGPSGSGKTTILRLAAGLIAPDSGACRAFAHQRASFVFQDDRLLPWRDALGNITELGVSRSDAERYLALVGLAGEESAYPDELSGGMRRRLAIGRALAFGGDLFFLDEPLRGLDVKTAEDIRALLRRELAGRTTLLITHDPEEAFALADRVVVISGLPAQVRVDRPISDFDSAAQVKKLVRAELAAQAAE